MRELKIKGRVVKICDSIFEIPIDNYQEFQKALTMEIHSGTTIADVTAHYEKLALFIQRGETEAAIEELNNLYTGAYLVLNGFDTTSAAFVHLIHSIDGIKLEEFDEVETKKILKQLTKDFVSQGDIHEIIEEVKKKLLTSYANFSQTTRTTVPN